MHLREVVVAEPRGFCAGVESAVKSLAWLVALNPPPVACVHAVVHNEDVVARFEAFGVTFVDRPEDVPPGAAVLLSAHGSAPGTAARVPGAHVVVDAVCPLVTKVHRELRARRAAGDTIVYVGHRGHDEAEGAVAHAGSPVHVVDGAAEAEALVLPPGANVAVLAQTTVAVQDWSEVVDTFRERGVATWTPARDDVCFATTNRQAATRALAEACDAVVVVGSRTSSNTGALVRTARGAGCRDVHLVAGPQDLPPLEAARIGVTAGASTPASAVDGVLRALQPATVRTLRVVDETEYFPLAAGVRRQIDAAIRAGVLPPPLVDAFRNDRRITADALIDVLEGEGQLVRRRSVGVR